MITVRPLFLLFLLWVFAFAGCDTKNEFEDLLKDYFIKYYGEDGDQEGVDIIVNDDGTMLLLGNTISADADRLSRIFLVKVDAEGNILWQRSDYGNKGEYATDIEKTIDGNLIILSNIFLEKNAVTGANEYAIHLVKIDPNGDVIQDKEIASAGSQFGNSVTVLTDAYVPNGGYMVSGYTTDIVDNLAQPGVQSTDLLAILMNTSLDSVWTKQISNQLGGEFTKAFESKTYDSTNTDPKYKDQPFHFFGYSDDLEVSNDFENNFLGISITENEIPSFATYAGSPDFGERMKQTIEANGSGFISLGTQQVSPSQNRLVIARSETGSNGLRFISNSFKVIEGERNLAAVAVTQSPAGGRYLILSNETHPTGTTNLWLSKVGIEGEVYWSASFGSITKNDFAGTVRELDNGKIVILGTVELESQNSKMTLIKVNAKGELLN